MSHTVVQKSACIIVLGTMAALLLLVGMATPASAASTKATKAAIMGTSSTEVTPTAFSTKTVSERSAISQVAKYWWCGYDYDGVYRCRWTQGGQTSRVCSWLYDYESAQSYYSCG